MKELREIKDTADFMLAVLDFSPVPVKAIFLKDVTVEAYAPWTWPDTRIGWEKTYLVSIKLIGPVGFTDGPLDDLKPPAHPTLCSTCGGLNGHEDGCEVSK